MKVYVTFHPSSVLKGGFQNEARIIEDLRRFRLPAIKSPLSHLPFGKRIGFDTEYDPTGKLLTVGVADATRSKAYEVSDKDFKKAEKIIRGAKEIVGHSVAGDLDYLVRLGLAKEDWLRGINVRDSFLLARMVDENRGKGAYGLEALLLSEFNFGEWKSATAKLLKETGNATDWSIEQRTERCRLDAWATRILTEQFRKKAS